MRHTKESVVFSVEVYSVETTFEFVSGRKVRISTNEPRRVGVTSGVITEHAENREAMLAALNTLGAMKESV